MSVHRIKIPEQPIPGKPLGRHIVIDDRSEAFPAETAPALVSVRHASGPGMPLNQGDTSTCTGNALTGALNCIPHWAAGQATLTERDADAVYSDEQVLEGFGPFPPNDNGGSGLEVCKAAKARGWIFRYDHAPDVHAALLALVPRPCMFGVNWFTSFDDCDPTSGIVSIAPGATVRGGHEICADEIDAVNELVWFWQSWGLGYGLNGSGRFAMSFQTLATLFDQGADCVAPRTVPHWTATPLAA